MPAVGPRVEARLERHPGLNISVRALTSRQIERELTAFELDAGLTYLDFEPPSHMLAAPLYVERYMLAAAQGVLDEDRTPTWEDVAALPLCLLHQGMQNRRILDARLGERGLALRPVVTADSYVALFALVRQGRLCSIVPDSHAMLLDGLDWVRTFALPEADDDRKSTRLNSSH